MLRTAKLPTFIPPMLATPGEPFDSDAHNFEVKWDGTRMLAFVERGGPRLVNRHRKVKTERYPELAEALGCLPAGTILDGEVVVLRDGKPVFDLVMSREHAGSARTVAMVARSQPVTYMVFDLLAHKGNLVTGKPLQERRQLLEDLLARHTSPHVVFSQGIVGPGKRFFAEAVAQGLEGTVSKRLDSTYHAGARNGAWVKAKRSLELVCVVVGYVPDGPRDFEAVLAREEGGVLRPAGRLEVGFTNAAREDLVRWLRDHVVARPTVPCRERKAVWVEPGLVCRVACQELTSGGGLRFPVFKGLAPG